MVILSSAKKTIVDLTDGDIQVGGINLISGSLEYVLEADGDNSYWVAVDELEAGNEYTLSVREVVLVNGNAIGVTYEIVNLDNGTVHAAGTLDFTYSKQTRLFAIPNVEANYALCLYAGIKGQTTGNIVQFNKIQLEEGSCATTWALSPEDTNAAVSNLSNDLEQLDADVLNRIEKYVDELNLPEEYATVADYLKLGGRIEAAESKFTQYDTKFTTTFNRIQVNEDGIKEIKSHVDWGSTNEGIPYLDLKTSESKIKMRLTNTKLAFIEGEDNELAYLSDNKLYVTRMEVINQVSFGSQSVGYMDIVPTPTGVAFRWRT